MGSNILICSSVFGGSVNSAGRHMYDLAEELLERKFSVDVVYGDGIESEKSKGFRLMSVKLKLKQRSYFVRFFYEFSTPFFAFVKYWWVLRHRKYDDVIVYSPSIFWFLLIELIGRKKFTRKILIIRDIFPLWMKTTGLIQGNSLRYRLLDYY